MTRQTGQYHITRTAGEEVRAFVSVPLPPADPPLAMDDPASNLHRDAMTELARLTVAGSMVPTSDWFLYGFVRKEAVVTSQIEGTQATFQDVVAFEATNHSDRPDDVREVCNYVAALEYTRAQVADPNGLPLGIRLLCEAHRILMAGVHGKNKLPGEVRRSQNWIGGSRAGNARFVPPPPDEVADALGTLERWFHEENDLPPLVRVGLAHVQFETIHPFLDGNGRLLMALLLEHWGLLDQPLFYVSLALKRNQKEYYVRLMPYAILEIGKVGSGFFLVVCRQSLPTVCVSLRLSTRWLEVTVTACSSMAVRPSRPFSYSISCHPIRSSLSPVLQSYSV